MTKIQPDEIFQLKAEFEKDPRKNKINGGIGIYLDERGEPYVHDVVKKVVKKIKIDNFNYLPIAGDPVFLTETAKLMLGKDLFSEFDNFLAKQGVMGGTNGLFLWGSFIKKIERKPKIIIGEPTWENHERIFQYLGFQIVKYKHLNEKRNFNYEAVKKTIQRNPHAYILFHAGPTHNPTGINPDNNQWNKLAKTFRESKNQALFDFAYMGLAEDIEKDTYGIKLFIKNKISTSVIVSYSKNMTLYQHRTGTLFILGKNKKEKETIESNLQYLFRIINSNPSAFGELIVKTILESKELKNEWIESLKIMANSLNKRRILFIKYTNGKFNFVRNGRGLFSLLFLTKKQIQKLKEKYGIYMLLNSRINFGGISVKNVSKVAKAVLEVF